MYVYVLTVYLVSLCLWGSEKGVRSPGPGVRDGCELQHVCWLPNPGPLEGQPVLLTDEPTPQAFCCILTEYSLKVCGTHKLWLYDGCLCPSWFFNCASTQ